MICPAVREEQEAAHLQAEAEARRAQRAKKTQRRQEKDAGIDTRGDDELEQRPDISVSSSLINIMARRTHPS